MPKGNEVAATGGSMTDIIRRKQLAQQRAKEMIKAADADQDRFLDADGEPDVVKLIDSTGFSLFGRADLFLLLVFLFVLWLYVKSTQKIDLAVLLWEQIGPAYDGDGSLEGGFFGDDVGEL
jgi:hypothetical protein